MHCRTRTTDEVEQLERRKDQDRRKSGDRRSKEERRHDFRDGNSGQRKTIRVWLRSVTKTRLGVDRRKNDRRENSERRMPQLGVFLTQEEIADLLSL
jgi:hypothetical protein